MVVILHLKSGGYQAQGMQTEALRCTAERHLHGCLSAYNEQAKQKADLEESAFCVGARAAVNGVN